jgi:glyoxylase-like metal-dependent hydrolase (beta-lactamase superfamily II)
MIGDARLDRVADLPRFELGLTTLFPGAAPSVLEGDRSWLEPQFMSGDVLALSVHSVVLRVDGRVILIDTCVGEHKPRPRQRPWNERSDTGYLAGLAALGLGVEDIDIVFCTHLHADHVGWNTRLLDGRWVPTFPRARYLMGRAELAAWQQAAAANPQVNHGSFADSVLPAIAAGQVDRVDAGHELLDGVVVCPLPGHSPGQVGLRLHRCGERALFCGDAIHHPVQLVRPDWSSAFCSDPALARQTRGAMLGEVADQGAWLIPAHFMGLTGMRIRRAGARFMPLDVVGEGGRP